MIPVTEHHPDCPRYAPLDDAVAIIKPLLKAMEAWAADEDGIPDHAWTAYERAKIFVGEPTPDPERKL